MTDLAPSGSATGGTTGPRTDRAKAAVKLNAVSHGIMSLRPVVPGLESAEEWDAHRRGIFESCAPVGHLEHTYAFRIAFNLWRLNRVGRYETEEIALAQETAEDDAGAIIAARLDDGEDRLSAAVLTMPREPHAIRRRLEQARLAVRALAALSEQPAHETVPDDHAAAALQFLSDACASRVPIPTRAADRWTGSSLRTAAGHIAVNRSLGDVLPQALRLAQTTVTVAERQLASIEATAARLRRQRILPPTQVLDRVSKYEAHLYRLIAADTRALETLQATRYGRPIPTANVHVSGLPETRE